MDLLQRLAVVLQAEGEELIADNILSSAATLIPAVETC
jgi:hypothetical protein